MNIVAATCVPDGMKRLMNIAYKMNEEFECNRPLFLVDVRALQLFFEVDDAIHDAVAPRRVRISFWQWTISQATVGLLRSGDIDVMPPGGLVVIFSVFVGP